MSNYRNLALALLTAPLLGCSPPPATPPAPPAAASTATDAPETMIGRQVAKAIGKAREELATSNISISDGVNININGYSVRRAKSSPNAEISPAGDLLIDGKPVVVTPAQRAELLQYRAHVIAIAEAGMAVGVKGADIAGEALSGVAGAIFSGEEGTQAFEQRMEAKGALIEAEALKICAQLPPLLASQQRLADSLPAFKPYATMTQADVDDCAKDKGSRTDAERARVREEVRSRIRETIREAAPGG